MVTARYTEEFKVKAVKQITDRGHAVAEVAARLGYPRTACTNGSSATACPHRSERKPMPITRRFVRLKRELKRVTEERDILKKAATYFAKQSG